MAQPIAVLILDDNDIIAECIQKRMLKTSATFFESIQLEIIPIHLRIDISNITEAAEKIKHYLLENNIQFLVLDRTFFNQIDPQKTNESGLDQGALYVQKEAKGVIITDILKHVDFSKVKKLKGVILYTYDNPSRSSEYYVDSNHVKQALKNSIGNVVDSNNIEIVLTNSEIYHLAKLELYDEVPKQVKDYLFAGKKSDFMLYGLFMGELLYHRIIRIIDRQQKHTLATKKSNAKIKLVLLFIVFTSLSIGGSALYSLAIKEFKSDAGLVLLSIVLSFIVPLFILLLKPEWIISVDADSDKN